MVYGLNQEPLAIAKYEKATNVEVKKNGVWVHQTYPHLGASPVGLIYEDSKLIGIIEIKCLEILKHRTISQLIECMCNGELSAKGQCFTIKDQQMLLCRNHTYYYQIQLLMTEASFCDFVLDSGISDPHIERIFNDLEIQSKISINTYKFWKHVMVPEYFLCGCHVNFYLLFYRF